MSVDLKKKLKKLKTEYLEVSETFLDQRQKIKQLKT